MNSPGIGLSRLQEVWLQVTAPDGLVRSHQLARGRMLLVGSGRGAGLELKHEDIGSIHCAFSIVDEGVVVRDWGSVIGTEVDGAVVEDESFARSGSIVIVGPFKIRISGNAADSNTAEPVVEETVENEIDDIAAERAAASSAMLASDIWAVDASKSSEMESPPPVDDQGLDVDDFLDLAQEVHEAVQAAVVPAEVNPMESEDDSWMTSDPFESDGESLVRSELEYLQQELEQRDARIRELEAIGSMPLEKSEPADEPTSVETERLVSRVEGLLDELEQSDRRIRQLEESLRLSEEASEAERDERRNLEDWVTQIEQKVAEREEEWEAQRDSLKQEIGLLRGIGQASSASAQQLQVQELVSQESLDAGRVAQLLAELERLRNENAELKTAPAVDSQTREEVERELRASLEASSENERRDHQMELSTERAELARLRKDLARQEEEMQKARERLESEDGNADQRIRAFRDHLREIKSQEDEARKQKRLSSRIASLWSRLEGR